MSRTERKSLLLQRAAALGVVSAITFLRAHNSPASHSHSADSAPSDQITLAPVPAPSYSHDSFLYKGEREQLAREVREYRIACDSAGWQAGKARGAWLLVIA